MGLKDDFLEALGSVKKDIFNGSEDTDPQTNEGEIRQASETPVMADAGAAGYYQNIEQEIPPPPIDDEAVFDAFKQASVIHDAEFTEDALDADSDASDPSAPPTFVSYDPAAETENSGGVMSDAPVVSAYGTGKMYDFDRTDLYSDDKTVISKNTVINGNLQTDDSVRLLGQVHGDIDCKSNIVVAGKVRGNTSAANAYIMDAQIDGSLHCDDVVSVSSDAWVLGDVRAQQAEIDGKIKGNLDIRHAVSIGSTSSIIGNISTDELEIKRGAFINGQIMMYTPSRDILDRFEDFDK